LYLKNICDRVYQNYELETRTCLKDIFKDCSLFGYSPYEIKFDEEEQGRRIQIRDDDFQKRDGIPWGYDLEIETNLNVENQAKIPLWWYKKDVEEYGEGHLFTCIPQKIGRREKYYWICKIPYNKDVGFIYDTHTEQNTSPNNNIW